MKKSIKIWFWLIITLLVLVGSYLLLSREGMTTKENCYTNSNGYKVCVSNALTCVNTPDGGRYCSTNQGVTSCTQYKSCDECVNGMTKSSDSKCYWNKDSNKCGSFLDNGYASTCPIIPPADNKNSVPTPLPARLPTPLPTPLPTSVPVPVPANCSSLLLLEGPVYIDPSAIPKKYRDNAI
jgi:hypothetical protein